VDAFFSIPGQKQEGYSQIVLVDETLTPAKQELLHKILKAYGWSKVEVSSKDSLSGQCYIDKALVFGQHLEEEAVLKNAKDVLVAPTLQDMLDEPALKKVLWRKMQESMRGQK